MDGERAIADTLYAATEEMEHAVPELRATTDSIADVIAQLIYEIDPSTLQVEKPNPAALLPTARPRRVTRPVPGRPNRTRSPLSWPAGVRRPG